MQDLKNCPHCGSNNIQCFGPGEYYMNPRVRGDYKRAINYYCNECHEHIEQRPTF